MSVRGFPGILCGHFSLVDQLVDHAVVLGQSSQQPLSIEVDPRVACVCNKCETTADQCERERGACARKAFGVPHLIHRARCLLADGVQCLQDLVSSALSRVSRVMGDKMLKTRTAFLKDLYAKIGGPIPSKPAANPIGDHVDAVLGVRQNAVLDC